MSAPTLLYANNASTTLAAGISNTATSMTVNSSAEFAAPVSGQAFFCTLNDAATGLLEEIVLVTGITGTTWTIQRGAQGTTALSWNAADLVSQYVTAGDMQSFAQIELLQTSGYTSATATGTANAITAALPGPNTNVPNGFYCILKALGANTGAVTLTLTLGGVAQATLPIKKFNNAALAAGDIPGAGYPIWLSFSTTYNSYVMINPATLALATTATNIAGGALYDIPYQASAGVTEFISAPTVHGQVLTYTDTGDLGWLSPTGATANPLVFNGAGAGDVVGTEFIGGALRTISYNSIGALSVNWFTQSGQQQLASPAGWQKLPGGLIVKWGRLPYVRDSAVHVWTYSANGGIAFPNATLVVIPSLYSLDTSKLSSATSVVGVGGYSRTTFSYMMSATWAGGGGPQINYIALGY